MSLKNPFRRQKSKPSVEQAVPPAPRPDPVIRPAPDFIRDFPRVRTLFPKWFALYLTQIATALKVPDDTELSALNLHPESYEQMQLALQLAQVVTWRETVVPVKHGPVGSRGEEMRAGPGPGIGFHHLPSVLEHLLIPMLEEHGDQGVVNHMELQDRVRALAESNGAELRRIRLTGDEWAINVAEAERFWEIKPHHVSVLCQAIEHVFKMLTLDGELVRVEIPYKDDLGFDEVRVAYVLPKFVATKPETEPNVNAVV